MIEYSIMQMVKDKEQIMKKELVLNTIANYINYYDTLENECKNNTEYTLKDLVDDIRNLINQ